MQKEVSSPAVVDTNGSLDEGDSLKSRKGGAEGKKPNRKQADF
jgi:hypothetical protein